MWKWTLWPGRTLTSLAKPSIALGGAIWPSDHDLDPGCRFSLATGLAWRRAVVPAALAPDPPTAAPLPLIAATSMSTTALLAAPAGPGQRDGRTSSRDELVALPAGLFRSEREGCKAGRCKGVMRRPMLE